MPGGIDPHVSRHASWELIAATINKPERVPHFMAEQQPLSISSCKPKAKVSSLHYKNGKEEATTMPLEIIVSIWQSPI